MNWEGEGLILLQHVVQGQYWVIQKKSYIIQGKPLWAGRVASQEVSKANNQQSKGYFSVVWMMASRLSWLLLLLVPVEKKEALVKDNIQ